MTPEAQRIAIAEACGWRNIDGWHVRPDQVADFNAGRAINSLPNYLSDLNAMHEAEKTLTGEQTWGYCHLLSEEINNGPHMRWALAHATAAQRAEAFLRTLGRWTS